MNLLEQIALVLAAIIGAVGLLLVGIVAVEGGPSALEDAVARFFGILGWRPVQRCENCGDSSRGCSEVPWHNTTLKRDDRRHPPTLCETCRKTFWKRLDVEDGE